MEMVLAEQTRAFLYAAALGAFLGFFYDVLALFRRLGGGGVCITALLDLLFCLTGAAGFFLLVFGQSQGIIRAYLLLGACLGAALYAALCSPSVRKILGKIQGFFAFFRRKAKVFREKRKGGTK